MYQYSTTSKDDSIQINTPGITSNKDITVVSTTKDDCIITKSTYPNGFCIESIQYANKIVLKCNRELIKNEDGSYTAPTL